MELSDLKINSPLDGHIYTLPCTPCDENQSLDDIGNCQPCNEANCTKVGGCTDDLVVSEDQKTCLRC